MIIEDNKADKMKNKIIVVLAIVVAIAAFTIYYAYITGNGEMTYEQAKETYKTAAKIRCESLCKQKLNESQDLSNGPCFSNEIAPDWVCDVAHNPRSQIDSLPENQCSAFGKTAKHFVEVDENCNLIRAV